MDLTDFKFKPKAERIRIITEYCIEQNDDEALEKYMKQWNRFYRQYPELILTIICKIYNVDFKAVKTKSRDRELVEARQMFFHYCFKQKKCTGELVGEYFGKDHATVLHGCKNFKNLLDTDSSVREKYFELQAVMSRYTEYL